MSRINYFEPYISKSQWHEDQLTRAFLVVLRYSPASLFLFYDLVYKSCEQISISKNLPFDLPTINNVISKNVEFDTQKTDITLYLANKILSVLITDDKFEPQNTVTKSERGARYDGIISFFDELLIVIENKPKSYNVWEEQLNPNLGGLPDKQNVELIAVPSIIEWKEIIRGLNALVKIDSIGGAEKLIINDFLDYVDRNFAFLNPYDNLQLCKKDPSLLQSRLRNILMSISKKEEDVYLQQGWRNYCIETGFDEIKLVCLILKEDKENYKIVISLCYGDTLVQSRSYFYRKLPFTSISNLIKKGWSYIPNFHISHIQKHLLWFRTDTKQGVNYYDYWTKHVDEIKQYNKSNLPILLDSLQKNNVIILDDERQEKLKSEVYDKNRNKINICVGFALDYSFDLNKAEILDEKGVFSQEVKNKIIEGLSILNKTIKFLK